MSSVAVYRDGHFSHYTKFRQARSGVQRGRYRWRQEFSEVEDIRAAPRAQFSARVLVDPPKDAHFLWRKRLSWDVEVLQAKWGKTVNR